MTRDEILKMEAGREMDALVAEKIFNGQWLYKNIPENLPKFSASISAAWEVVERLIKHNPLSLDYLVDENNVLGWQANFRMGYNVAFAPTAPLAICRAALLAVMKE
jgi:hypothetical protein